MSTVAQNKPFRWQLMQEPSDRLLIAVLAVVGLVFFIGSMWLVADDVLLYSMIGKAIYVKGMLPYTYVFDHKPILSYYVYGLLALLPADDAPKFQIVSVVGFALSAILTKFFARKESWWIHFLVIVGLSIHFLRFSGNIELFFSPLAIISLLLVMRSETMVGMFFGGVFAAMSFNMNYLAVFSIGPAVLYAMWSAPGTARRRLSGLGIYALGFVLTFILLLLPLILKDSGLVAAYFNTQRRFLSAYGAQEGRPFLFFFVTIIPIICLAIASLPCAPAERRTRNVIALSFAFAFLASIVSGKYFSYYVYPSVLPLTILWAMSTYRHKRLVLLACMAWLVLVSVPVYLREVMATVHFHGAQYAGQFEKMKSIVGDEKVLSIRAHHSITYFAHVEPAQPLLWPNHAYLLMGDKEDEYFMGELKKRPKFVVTTTDLCSPPPAKLPLSCAAVLAGYTNIMTLEDKDYRRRAYLYRLN